MAKKSDPLVSIIIRVKNEERWISSCLRSIFNQVYKNFEVIVVDNKSSDQTLSRARDFPVKVIQIDEFLPGKAINQGIHASRGEYLVCISGHCIPVNEFWLSKLVEGLSDPSIAGVYGRQEPLSFTSDIDKRDLITVFGLDKKIQIKDSFFHNANSAFRRNVWQKFPFDETVTNIEDRVWGRQVIAAGLKIIYEPEASVYHWHGIHQDLNTDRARNVVRILESLDGLISSDAHLKPDNLNIISIIPVRGKSCEINSEPLLQYTIRAAQGSRYISEIVVSTDNSETAMLARNLGAKVPFLRPQSLSENYIDVMEVARYTLDQLEMQGLIPDLIVLLEETYPFRSSEMLDDMIMCVVKQGFDSVVAAQTENRGIWLKSNDEMVMLGEGFMPRPLKKSKAMIGLIGLGYVTYPHVLREGNLFQGKVGVIEVNHPLSSIEVSNQLNQELAEKFIAEWWNK